MAREPLTLPSPPFVCGWQPNPLETMPYACPMCGHAAMAHVGCKECPVCVLVMQSTPAWRRQQARIHGLSSPY